ESRDHAADVSIDQPDGDAVVGGADTARVLSDKRSAECQQGSHLHQPPPTSTNLPNLHRHGSLTVSVHVVSSPVITTRSGVIVFTRNPAMVSPCRTGRGPSTFGSPSTRAVGSRLLSQTMPTRASTGFGGGGVAGCASRTGS